MLVEPGGLVRGHLLADIEKHVSIGFFEVPACNDYFINLGIDLGFIKHATTGNFF